MKASRGKATPGEWRASIAICCPDVGTVCDGGGHSLLNHSTKKSHAILTEDAECIVAAHSALPLLLDLAEAVEEADTYFDFGDPSFEGSTPECDERLRAVHTCLSALRAWGER